MTSILHSGKPVRRHSFLKRNAQHSRAFFSGYYEHQHGPLASSQAGFRKYTVRYIQNHVLELPDGSEPPFDGCTQTTQVIREDYSTGFFTEADYANVIEDEKYLFDISGTISVLGAEAVIIDGERTPFKVLLLTSIADFADQFEDAQRVVLNRLDTSTASALGFSKGSFAYDGLVELWFVDETARQAALRANPHPTAGEQCPIMLPVREVLIFGPEMPWPGT